MNKFPKDDVIHGLLWNFLSEIVCAGSSGNIAKNNFQNLLASISSRQLSLSTSFFQIPNSLSENFESYIKSCNTKNVTSEDLLDSSYVSKITSESIASSLFNNLDFSKAMSLIGLSPTQYKTNSLKHV